MPKAAPASNTVEKKEDQNAQPVESPKPVSQPTQRKAEISALDYILHYNKPAMSLKFKKLAAKAKERLAIKKLGKAQLTPTQWAALKGGKNS